MGSKVYLIMFGVLIIGFVGGFLIANSLNKAEIDRLKSQQLIAQEETQKGNELSAEEIEARLKEADQKPEDFNYQKGLGMALYSYAASKQDDSLLEDVERLLKRAHELKPDDYVVLVSYASIQFDIGKNEKDLTRLSDSRKNFEKALKIKPDDARVLSNLALTYLEVEKPEPDKALGYLEKAYELDPKDPTVLANFVRLYLARGELQKSREYVSKLKEAAPGHPLIKRFESRITLEEQR